VWVPRNKRPPLYWRTLLVGAPAVVGAAALLTVDGHGVAAVAVVLFASALFIGPWLLSPYSKVAMRLAWPSDKDFARSERLADWLGSIPVFGAVWRAAERVTGNAGRRGADEYRHWQREHDDEHPT
jgi:hypothetical protein